MGHTSGPCSCDDFYPTKQQLVEHIQTLNSLIDGCEDDELGRLLTPIVAMLEKMVSPLIATKISGDHGGDEEKRLSVNDALNALL